MVELPFSKGPEGISGFYNSFDNSITQIMFQKAALSEKLQADSLQLQFFEKRTPSQSKYWKMLWKGSVMELLCSKLLAFKLQPSFLLVLMFWKIPNIAVELLFTEAGTKRFSTE